MSANEASTVSRLSVAQTLVCDFPRQQSQTEVSATLLRGIKRRWVRERRRRRVARAYDMALEIARVIPRRSKVLDVGCGNGFIAHHLSAMLGKGVIGIDVTQTTEAPIDYRHYDGRQFPVKANSFDAVLLCYVLHHTQNIDLILKEIRRVLRNGGVVIIYEDTPATWWDEAVCWVHNRHWQNRTGPCTFRDASKWQTVFNSFGFEIVSVRSLSRWRNVTHPVQRRLFLLRRDDRMAATATSRPRTKLRMTPDVRVARCSS